MKICLKELRETQIWLRIIERKPMCEANRLAGIIKECDELIAIFVSSVKTAEEKEKQ
jgi:four helix bundle protein